MAAHLTCTECGSAEVQETQTASMPLTTMSKVNCAECGEEGKIMGKFETTGPAEVREGNFAQLSTKGVETLRSNL